MSACGACVTVVVSEYESKIKRLQESHNTLRKVAHALGVCYCWDFGCEPAGVDDLLARVHDLLDLECEKLDRDFAPEQSRREQRRARKAAKNWAMVKLVGWRPWSPGSYGHTKLADRTVYGTKKIPGDAMDQVSWWWMQEWDNEERDFHGKRFAARLPDFMNDKLIHLREPSGFVAMSRVAEQAALDAKLAALNARHQASMAKLEADGINIYADPEHM